MQRPPAMSDAPSARPTRFRTGGLSPRKPTQFAFRPDQPARAVLAQDLGILAVHRMEFQGQIAPAGRDAFLLTGRLTAEVDQACIVTLAPVRSRIDEEVRRRFVAGIADPEGDEAEMPEDVDVEPMPEVIDIEAVAAEALVLALPPYPRAAGAVFGAAAHAGDGITPLEDRDLKPFAGLAALAGRLTPPPDEDTPETSGTDGDETGGKAG
jgi:uncharacterized metal-binding protein YceD (DUF177 family)